VPSIPKPNNSLADFSREISAHHLAPLWERTMRMQPGSACTPALWRYSHMRPLLARAAELITTRDAERRVLVLENPTLRGSYQITQSLFAGLQIILPGEIAPSHRHTPNALRFVIEGEGAYTAVDGTRLPMSPGDFVVTPNWAWHDHGNLGSGPVVWLDGLDTPFAQFFGAMFRENHPQESQPVTQEAGNAPTSLRFPYASTRNALAQLAKHAPGHLAHGVKVRYTTRASGGNVFPTMAAFLQLLPQGYNGRGYRCTDGAVFCVVEGRGIVYFDAEPHAFEAHDCFVIPPWQHHRFAPQSECVLFSFSDRAAQEALGFWREALD
jgi:gentisate 1,2-dioxygenase